MNRETSIYLDLIRFLASMIVLLGHLAGERFTGGLFWQFAAFMDDAVIVFFVLSGFVIAYTVKKSESYIESFAINRAARIYSVALPALFLTFLLDYLGKSQAPNLYSVEWGYQNSNVTWQFLSGLLFLNESWLSPIPVGSMLPYWSLSYEVWYYVLFAALYFMSGKRRIFFVVIACCIAGPRILVMFPLWILGYLSYSYSTKFRPFRVGFFLISISIIGYACHHFYLKPWLAINPDADLPAQIFGDDFYARYITGFLFACHLLGFAWVSNSIGAYLHRWEAAIRWVAGATFTIYLLHLPVAQFLTTLVPWTPSDWRTRVFILLGTLVTIFVIADLTERRKAFWRKIIMWIYSRVKVRALRPYKNHREEVTKKFRT